MFSRTVAVVALLAVAALGLRGYGAFPATGHSVGAGAGQGTVVLLGFFEGAAVIGCILLLAVIFRVGRRSKNPEDEPEQQEIEVPWWVRPAALLLALAVVAVPAVLVYLSVRGHHRRGIRPGLLAPPGVARPAAGAAHAASSAATGWAAAAGAAAVVLAAIVLLVLAALRRRRLAPGGPAPDPRPPLADSLAAATSAGADALLGLADPRAAIIACYGAMERSLAAAGLPPSAADTPADVLAAALAGGLVRPAGPGRLTCLFRLARYSEHEMTAGDRSAALDALTAIRVDLAAGRPAAVSAAAGSAAAGSAAGAGA